MDKTVYMNNFSPLFNKDAWVLAESSQKRPFTGFVDMFESMSKTIDSSDKDKQLSLIKDHPDLACPEARQGDIPVSSQEEQKKSGLNSCTAEEAKKLNQLNKAYHDKFGFPFLLAVKGYNKNDIFIEFEDRLKNTPELEFKVAMQQYKKVLLLRMLDLVK